MANNVTLPATGTGTATPTFATDDVAGVHYPIAKLALGDEDSTTRITAANGLPVNVVAGSAAGTQYSEGTTVLSIVGQAVLWEDTSDVLRTVSAAKPMPVNVVTGSTAGTQYTEADTDATITGTAVMWEDASDTLRAASVGKPLPVQVVTSPGGSVLPDPIVNSSAVAVPIKFARINATLDGDNTVVAGVATKKLRVLGYAATATGAETITFKSAGATVIGEVISSGNGGGDSYAGGVDAPAFETAAGEALVVNNPVAGIDTKGHLSYIEV